MQLKTHYTENQQEEKEWFTDPNTWRRSSKHNGRKMGGAGLLKGEKSEKFHLDIAWRKCGKYQPDWGRCDFLCYKPESLLFWEVASWPLARSMEVLTEFTQHIQELTASFCLLALKTAQSFWKAVLSCYHSYYLDAKFRMAFCLLINVDLILWKWNRITDCETTKDLCIIS